MKAVQYWVGIGKKGVFWSCNENLMATPVWYPLEYYMTRYGLLLPLSSASHEGLELFKHLAAGAKESEIKKHLPNFNNIVRLLHVDFYGNAALLSSNEEISEPGNYSFTKIPIPKPKEGWTVSCSKAQDLGIALTLVSHKFSDHKKLFEFHNKEMMTNVDVDRDLQHVSYEYLRTKKPADALSLGRFVYMAGNDCLFV